MEMKFKDEGDKIKWDEGMKRVMTAAHAVQTGVKFEMAKEGLVLDPVWDKSGQGPKHLRVGVNMAMCETSTITRLLVEKGIFTWGEFASTYAEVVEEEKAKYEKQLGINLA